MSPKRGAIIDEDKSFFKDLDAIITDSSIDSSEKADNVHLTKQVDGKFYTQ